MKRTTAAAALVLFLLVPAASASAKGEDMGPIEGTATITGPGLSAPIVVHWKGRCLAYCPDALKAMPVFLQLANAAGLFTASGPTTHLQPVSSRLGPRYTLAFVLQSKHDTLRNTVAFYPYGPSDLPRYIKTMPWVYAAPGQRELDLFGYGRETLAPSGWWTAAPSLLHTLHRLGLPARPPAGASSSNVAVAGIAGGLVGFVILIVAGAAFGRPKRRQPAR
jgi:hypothetical protein